MNIQIDTNWKLHLAEELAQPYFSDLLRAIDMEYDAHRCYPHRQDIFSAFSHCRFEDTKVVIIGQDPYHGPDQANGLCFSVKEAIKHPPSLRNIFKELEADLGIQYPENGNLGAWAEQGVLLLNTVLTVREGEPGSHKNLGWEVFTNAVIKKLSKERENIIFLLWGGFAKTKANLIDTKKHHIFISGHPSPLSANRGYWFGNKHFSKCNNMLIKSGKSKIYW